MRLMTVFYRSRDTSSNVVTKFRVGTVDNINDWLKKPKSNIFSILYVMEGEKTIADLPKKIIEMEDKKGVVYKVVPVIQECDGIFIAEIQSSFVGWVCQRLINADVSVNPLASSDLVAEVINLVAFRGKLLPVTRLK